MEQCQASSLSPVIILEYLDVLVRLWSIFAFWDTMWYHIFNHNLCLNFCLSRLGRKLMFNKFSATNTCSSSVRVICSEILWRFYEGRVGVLSYYKMRFIKSTNIGPSTVQAALVWSDLIWKWIRLVRGNIRTIYIMSSAGTINFERCQVSCTILMF